MRTFGWVLVGLFVVLLVYLFFRRRKALHDNAGQPSPATRSSKTSLGSTWNSVVNGVEGGIQGYTKIPVASIDSASRNAPTWLKAAVLPIGVTAVTASVVRNPVGSAKAVAGATVGAAKAVGGAAATAGRTVGGAVSSAGHALASIF